ncbi:conserved hypothetical protein [Vibrio chagasii]|nr:conserved hypothetical protein [Vibrio chagasii]CAH7346227.1 conserved hypothetical protein [Vibrio chagasii]
MSTQSQTNKITRDKIVGLILEQLESEQLKKQIGANKSNIKATLNNAIEFLKFEVFCKGKIAQITGYGKLVPKLKEGGRIVRNPKTGIEKTMHTSATVTRTDSYAFPTQERLTHKQMVDQFASSQPNRQLATFVIESLFSFFKETNDPNVVIEFRDFGTFYAKKLNAGVARNPATEEKVMVDDRYKFGFKIGKPFRKELTEHLEEINFPTNKED